MFESYKRFAPSLAIGLGVCCVLLGLIFVCLTLLLLEAKGEASVFAIDAKLIRTLAFTSVQAGLSTLASLAMALPLSWALSHQRKFLGRRLLVALLSVAMVLPALVAVLGLVTVWGRRGWFNDLLTTMELGSTGSWIYGIGGILLAHCFLNAPFMARSLLQRFEAIPTEQRKLSRSLDLSAWQRFRFMEWPAIKGSLPALCSTVFLLCFTSFAIVLTLGGSPKYNTLEVAIYEAIKLDFDIRRAVILALTQLAVCAVLVSIASSFRITSKSVSEQNYVSPWPETGTKLTLQIALIGLFAVFFLAPLAAIVVNGTSKDLWKVLQDPLFHRTAFNSLALATASALLTLLMAITLIKARVNTIAPERMPQTKLTLLLRQVLSFSGSLYLAVPSLVMAFGFFLLARQLFSSIYFVAPVALILANALLALPFAMAVLGPAIEKTASKHDRLAFTLRIKGWSRWRLLEWPLIRQEVAFVSALAFCFSLGDFGIISLFGSQDFATLPWLLYQKMGSYRTDEAAAIALILLIITLTVFLAVPTMRRGKSHA
ncbi:ABC transporter permease subunit [Alphaproteobacteria bacterium]|nr:ABC transporter permease subunit [Alphaproteobacteria bacterium]